ncbi:MULTISPECIES: hypothetical protein [unclassified Leptolyngbya]|uniref:hypothetical protein n=1 Tax=unclassified Leptolyngbya TaxID=2650499 RepID=UPI0016882CD5|nr:MULTISPECIES: hypothetical protein [unclassified Leptolyngbya]MBD1913824.1 hypothetical protein [Leptolyngbya sp. FACHB-8]MBD2156537.1 hypothetical protein [Leptolyngbya sp. FACHB-16]
MPQAYIERWCKHIGCWAIADYPYPHFMRSKREYNPKVCGLQYGRSQFQEEFSESYCRVRRLHEAGAASDS